MPCATSEPAAVYLSFVSSRSMLLNRSKPLYHTHATGVFLSHDYGHEHTHTNFPYSRYLSGYPDLDRLLRIVTPGSSHLVTSFPLIYSLLRNTPAGVAVQPYATL